MSRNYIKFYYNQNDYEKVPYNKPNGEKKNIKTSGCGVCSTAMAINNLMGKERYTISELATLSRQCGARINNGTNIKKLLDKICELNKSFKYDNTEYTKDLIKHLKNGGVAILHQGDKYNVFSSSGHFVYAYGLDTNGNIKVADPANTENRYKTKPRCNRIVLATKYGCIVKPEEVTKATTPISYYLISYTGKYYGDIIESPCAMFKCNAKMKNEDTVYTDNKRKIKVGKIKKNLRIKALGVGKTNTIIQYGIDKSTYKTGIVYTDNIKFD